MTKPELYNVPYLSEDGCAASIEAAQAAVLRRSALMGNRVHNMRYSEVAAWLRDAGIDPRDLRDYLAGLPEKE